MKTFMKTTLAAAMLVMGMAAQADIVVDDFSVAQAKLYDTHTDGVGLSSTTGFSSSILGGYRDLYVNKVGAAGDDASGFGVSIAVTGGATGRLSFSSDDGQGGYAIVRWDGAHFDNFSSIDATGLGGQNFAATGNAFVMTVLHSDAGFPFVINVYTDASDWTSLTLTAAGNTLPTTYVIPFALIAGFGTAHGTGVDFSNVGALEAIINDGGLIQNVDLSLDIIDIPEPGSLALAGLALVAVGAAGRRRQAKK